MRKIILVLAFASFVILFFAPSAFAQESQTRAQLEEAQAQLEQALTQLNEALTTLQDTSQTDQSASQDEVISLRQQLAQAQDQLEAQNQEQNDLNARNEQLRQALESAEAQNQSLSNALEEVQSGAAALREQLSTLSQFGAEQTQGDPGQLSTQPDQGQNEQVSADQSQAAQDDQTESDSTQADSTQADPTQADQAQTDQAQDSQAQADLTQNAQVQASQTPEQLVQAQTQAAERAATYISLRQETPDLSQVNDERRNEVETAQEDLLSAQNTVARLINAESTYTVEFGDFLSDIAVQFYQDGNRWTDIVEANSYLEDPNTLVPGMVLVIPAI